MQDELLKVTTELQTVSSFYFFLKMEKYVIVCGKYLNVDYALCGK